MEMLLTHAPRCGRACHSPASAYADSDILAGRVSAALRLRVRATLTGPDYQFDWRVCARVGHVCPTLLPSFHYFVFSIPPPRSPAGAPPGSDVVLYPTPRARSLVPPPLLFRIRRYTRSRYADLRASPVPCSFLALSNSINNAAASGSIHAAAARHAPAPYPALRSADSMPCLPSLRFSSSATLPTRSSCPSPASFVLAVPFPVSLPPPSRASMRRSINAAAPSVELLELPRGARADLRAASLWAPAPARTRPRSARLARGLAPHAHDLFSLFTYTFI
ncbi:hypothetical protein B0H14DRAFT_2671191 [Mycena olivaceomarginata]|nr:hypothetical protein B0H14DRAFT_2671191 [Mycena olivaceomarginata]